MAKFVFRECAEPLEERKRAVELTIVADFVAQEDVERAGVLAEMEEGAGGAGAGVGGVFFCDLVGERHLLKAPDAPEAPFGGSEAVDEGVLDLIGGLEIAAKAFGERDEGRFVLALED